MLSVILYGRNDNYGYNLHKRAAISLNCIAEILTDPSDEIIFVDYNTPDDFPTFPEAIEDTLTDRTKKLLRILRVRPHQHTRFRDLTKLVALEAVARNVGVRRSNPDNRWILSTNTDMIFVPRCNRSPSEIAASLPDAYYHLPRFEIPEPLWESLNRMDPAGTIATIKSWGNLFHLQEIVFARYPVTKYDGCGDFQLVLRSDMWRIQGFNESMLLGWHVDSNLAKRLALLPRAMGEVVDDLFGYHCDHTRQMTVAHRHGSIYNDVRTFFENVTTPYVVEQADTWGLPDEAIEELKVDTTSRTYLQGLRSAIPAPLTEPTFLSYHAEPNERPDYSVDHVLPFLGSILASYERTTPVGWFGVKRSLLSRFATMWTAMGFNGHILVSDQMHWLGPDLPLGCVWANDAMLDEKAETFVFDFGRPENELYPQALQADDLISSIADGFKRMIRLEERRLQQKRSARRFVGVNTIATLDVGSMFRHGVGAATTPMCTRITEGFLSDVPKAEEITLVEPFDFMPMMVMGAAGAQGQAPSGDPAVVARPNVAGPVIYGPYMTLPPGCYEATFQLHAERTTLEASIGIDVAAGRGRHVLARDIVRPHLRLRYLNHDHEVRWGPVTSALCFEVSPELSSADRESIEFRVWSQGTVKFCVTGVSVRQVEQAPELPMARAGYRGPQTKPFAVPLTN